ESLELRCRVDGLPRPEVFWTKDGIRIDDEMIEKELIILQYPDGRHELIVDYAVEVSNTYGAVWSETTVRPPSPTTSSTASTATSVESSLIEVNDTQPSSPRYTIILADKYLQQNDEFTAHVAINVECSPCEFFWTLNGRDIRTIPGFHIESTFYESTIYVKSMLSKQSGELSVVASNKYGTAKSTAKIIVHPLREKSYEFISEIETIPAERPPRIVLPLRPSVFRAGR
ncbi:hypothetical protein WUBG_15108, partial [Wuchereria bancrofti]